MKRSSSDAGLGPSDGPTKRDVVPVKPVVCKLFFLIHFLFFVYFFPSVVFLYRFFYAL